MTLVVGKFDSQEAGCLRDGAFDGSRDKRRRGMPDLSVFRQFKQPQFQDVGGGAWQAGCDRDGSGGGPGKLKGEMIALPRICSRAEKSLPSAIENELGRMVGARGH